MLLAAAGASVLYPQGKALATEPAARNAASPDPTTLIKTVWENQKQIEAARKDYIFHRKDEDEEFDSQGRVKTTRDQGIRGLFYRPLGN